MILKKALMCHKFSGLKSEGVISSTLKLIVGVTDLMQFREQKHRDRQASLKDGKEWSNVIDRIGKILESMRLQTFHTPVRPKGHFDIRPLYQLKIPR